MKKITVLVSCSLLVMLLGTEVLQAQRALPWRYCVLRKRIWRAPNNCYEFYLADTTRTDRGRMAAIGGGLNLLGVPVCAVTDLARRQGWGVDPNRGGPYRTYREASAALSALSIYGGNFYRCRSSRRR